MEQSEAMTVKITAVDTLTCGHVLQVDTGRGLLGGVSWVDVEPPNVGAFARMTYASGRYEARRMAPFDLDSSIRRVLEELGWQVSPAPARAAANVCAGSIVWYSNGGIILYPRDRLCSGADLSGCRTHDEVRIVVYKLIADATPKADESISRTAAAEVPYWNSPPKPAPRAYCPRCYGPARPAYTGLFSHEPLRCERVGGCLAEREPRVGQDNDATNEIYVFSFTERGAAERNWAVSDRQSVRYATRDLAVAAWREAAIAKAKAEHEGGGR